MRLEYAIIGVMIFLVSSVLGLIAYDPEFIIQLQSDKADRSTESTISFQKEAEEKPEVEKVEISITEKIGTTEDEIETQVVKEMPPTIIPESIVKEPMKSVIEEPPLPKTSTIDQEVSLTQIEVTIPDRAMYLGCEESRKCYIPSDVMVQGSNTVSWYNDDTAAHTVTSGNPIDGPNGMFDSGLFLADETFSYTFDELGEYQYFCTVHPWMTGTIFVN